MDAPERFEFFEEGAPWQMTRREATRFMAGGWLLTFLPVAPGDPGTRFHFGDDGTVTLFTGKVELGQGSRTLLTQVVADELHVDPAKVKVVMADTDQVPDDGGTYGSLTTPDTVPAIRRACEAARAVFRGDPARKPVLGTSLANVNGKAIVTGAHLYSSDIRRPGMVNQTVKRQPETKAPVPNLYQYLRDTSREPDPRSGGRYPAVVREGNLADGWKLSTTKVESTYRLAYIAHVPLEPRAAIAEWQGDRLTVWCGTQTPFLVRRELASAFQMPPEKVRLIVSDTGSGFGGKHRGECELEAARLARESGKCVRVAWTREEEFTCSYVRPAGVVDISSGLDREGRMVAWDHHNYNSGASGLRPPYAIPHFYCGFHPATSPLRQGSYRSLAAVANTFAREAQVDEMAHRVKQDPLEFRLRNITDKRLREALQKAAERFGWGKRKGAGMACTMEKEAALALFVEMDGPKRVARCVMTIDPGFVLNPGNLKNQAMGAIVQGIGGALFEEAEFDGQRIRNPRLSSYRVPRFADTPEIEIIPISRPGVPSAGAGESPITVVAPAISAALFTLTGKRLRSLPLLRGL